MMELKKGQSAAIGTLKDSQMKQDETIVQLRMEVESLTELVCVMKPTNQPSNEPKVIPEVIDSDDESLLEDELYQEMEETVQEQTDDEPLEYLAHLLQEEPEEQTRAKKPPNN